MPIYEYECGQCGERFELLLLNNTVPRCSSCQSQDLKQLLSEFAVSSEASRQSNLKAARRAYALSRNVRDQKVAEAEEIREHSPAPLPPPKKKS